MKTLKLYNAVKARKGGSYKILPQYGIIVEPSASYAIKEIEAYCKASQLSGEQLNKTFHKSWKKVLESTREELALHQILHYLTTYGTGHLSSYVYIPDEKLDVPEMKVNFLVIKGLTEAGLTAKSLDLLYSGVALKQETIHDILEVLADSGYVFKGDEPIKNKECLMILCRESGVVPKDPVEFVRYLGYLSTDQTLLIKSKKAIEGIKTAASTSARKTSVVNALNKADPKSLATVFNRVKPILLAYKSYGPSAKKIVNQISRLSKELHQPIAYNILNDIGRCTLKALENEKENLMNANFFQLARCLQYLKLGEHATSKVYQVRNGKFYSKPFTGYLHKTEKKVKFILDLMKKKYNLEGKKFFIPQDVFYSLPTSEKNFVGNVPSGTKFVADALSAGVYWENDGGARDIDLSGTSVDGAKVGWNSHYSQEGIVYSGDMTSASNGATEFLRFDKKIKGQYLIMANVYSGQAKGSKFNIVFGKGSNVSKDYMMDPNQVWFSAPTETLQKESVVGFVAPDGNKIAAYVVNAGFGNNQVSGYQSKHQNLSEALAQKLTHCFYLNDLLTHCGAEIVDNPEDCDVDLTPSKLEKDSILSIFK